MEGGGRWCNSCSNMVNPMREGENSKCPVCGSEFAEATMESLRSPDQNEGSDLMRSASVFSLYSPILLGLMSALRPALATISNNNNNGGSSSSSSSREEEDGDEQDQIGQHGDLVVRRRRRTSSTSLMIVFRRLHDRMATQPESDQNNTNTENDHRNNNNGRDNNNNNNYVNLNVVVIDPFNEEALILRGPSRARNSNPLIENPMGSLGDFLDGPGFGLLLQHLTHNNEPNRYVNNVNPPAQKAAIEAMPTVTTEENMQCIICLEDAEVGSEVKEMPCGHKFHSDCIISWLKLRSSCPVCRFQLPSEDTKFEANGGRRNEGYPSNDQVMDREQRMSFGRRNWLSILQPFDYFLPSP